MRRFASIRTLGALLIMFSGMDLIACVQEEAVEPDADGSSPDAMTSDAGESDAAPDAGPDEVDVAETDGVDGEVDAAGDISAADVQDVEPDTERPPCSVDRDCSAEEFCVSGACVPTSCTPRTLWCEGSTLLRCWADGTASVVRDCQDDELRCVESRDVAQCADPPACDAVEIVCRAESGEDASGSITSGTGETLQCRVENADDPEHAQSTYSWRLQDLPNGSAANLTVLSGMEASLTTDLEGAYTMKVTRTEVPTGRLCEAYLLVRAIAPDNIRVVLSWETPGDEDDTDDGLAAGADLDLHFLNPALGCWRDEYADCSPLNQHVDWGMDGNGWNDPSIDIDVTDGRGSENLNYARADDGSYRVGVHNYDSHDFGPSIATLRIYIAGLLAFEEQKELSQSEFWEVANIEWPTGAIAFVDVVQPGIADATCDP